MTVRLICAEAMRGLADIESQSVQCVVTSPPYWGLRDYKSANQFGTERNARHYIHRLVEVFHEIRSRVLKSDGTLWLNIGDCFSNKQLNGIPWTLAFALQDDGWRLRSDIIWSKPNPMPESVTDRPTRAHEYIFLLSKSPKYYYDSVAVRNPPSDALLKEVYEGYNGKATKDFSGAGAQEASATKKRIIEGARKRLDKQRGHSRHHAGFNDRWDAMTKAEQMALGSNRRSVWTISPSQFKGAHFATFPPALVELCIKAGCPEGETVLDPFVGSGTTCMVAKKLGRNSIGIDLNKDYIEMARERCKGVQRVTNS